MKNEDDPMLEALAALAGLYPDPDRGRVLELIRQNEAERAARGRLRIAEAAYHATLDRLHDILHDDFSEAK